MTKERDERCSPSQPPVLQFILHSFTFELRTSLCGLLPSESDVTIAVPAPATKKRAGLIRAATDVMERDIAPRCQRAGGSGTSALNMCSRRTDRRVMVTTDRRMMVTGAEN